ncbi:hypothetical protein D039_1903A, partial [Vibrio parahaemolyticus EKP-028]
MARLSCLQRYRLCRS